MSYQNSVTKNWSAIINSFVLRGVLTSKGGDYISRVVAAPPSRCPTNAGGRNLLVDLVSQKMGHTMQVESLSAEAAYARMLEMALSVIGYWAQPEKIPISYTDRDGIKRVRWVTFDFLVVELDGVWLVECKAEEKAIEISNETPGRLSRTPEGAWYSPEADESLKEYGIKCRVVTTADLNPTLLRNYSLLEELRQDDYSRPDALARIQNCIPIEGLPLADLLAKAGNDFSKNDVYLGLLCGNLHSLLDACLLVDHRTTRVFLEAHHAEAHRALCHATKAMVANPIILKPGTKLRWNGTVYEVCNSSRKKLYVRIDNTDPIPISPELLRSCLADGQIDVLETEVRGLPEQHAELARFRDVLSEVQVIRGKNRQQFLALRKIEPATKPEDFGLKASLRTIQRWFSKAKDSLLKYGTPFWGLLDEPRPGRPRDDLPAELRADMSKFADEFYFVPVKPTTKAIWRALCESRRSRSLCEPSEGAFRRHVDLMRNTYEATCSRDGKRAAYKFSQSKTGEPNWITAGDFPFKVGQMDGKLMDIGLVDEETGEYLGKPTLTLICLPHYGAVPIGWVLLFESESYRSATLAIRDMMERHGQPIKYLIVDNGKAFANITFDKLLAVLEISKVNRPPCDPRFASEIEGLFRTIDREFTHNLEGNTKSRANRETATNETDPKVSAVWTFQKFLPLLEEYLLSLWDAPSAQLGTTPRIAFERDSLSAPDRETRFTLSPEEAKMAYFPEVDGRTRIVQPGRGLRVEGYYYWNDSVMEDPSVERTSVRVLYDPFDLYVVFAAINGKWVECTARHAPELRNVTEKTRRVACLARRTLRNSHAKRREATHGVRLGAVGRRAREEEKVLRETRRANAQKSAITTPEHSTADVTATIEDLDFSYLRKSTA